MSNQFAAEQPRGPEDERTPGESRATERGAPDGERRSEEHAEHRRALSAGEQGRRALQFLRKKPGVGALVAGGLGLMAANVIGVGELAIALAAGYAVFRVLRESDERT
jgi:hypothetical protein